MFESPFDKLLWLMEKRNKVSMKEMFNHLEELHGEMEVAGYELARTGHYRKAFHKARRSPRSLQRGLDGRLTSIWWRSMPISF